MRQYLTSSGRTLFKGMGFDEVKRMQVDIECITTEGYEFCNAQRDGDRIVAIGLADESGWTEVLSGLDMDETELLERFVSIVTERDPDLIEGHNIFNFDLPYIMTRAKHCKVKMGLGRDGSVPRSRPSRMAMGDRAIAYTRCDIFGRHVVDTLFLVQAFDLSERSLEGFGLKEVAVHLGVAAKNRVYVDGSKMTQVFKSAPDKVMRYVRDDVVETRAVSTLLLRSYILQSQILPYSCQNVCVRGNATKIDSLMVREYVREGHAIPIGGQARRFAGGYTDIFVHGVAKNVHHCDVRSLYPSLMLTHDLGPRSDELGVFLRMLELLKTYRLEAKEKMQSSRTKSERSRFDALQGTFKILINSFYGYLGFTQGQFRDFEMAEKVTSQGRSLLRKMISSLLGLGATPIEIDTDGIYFVPPGPDGRPSEDELAKFREDFEKTLPKGIDVEFDGEYEAMYSYKMKNYALLHRDGEMTIRGAALKSRGLARFQRSFVRRLLKMKLAGLENEIPGLKDEYDKAIAEGKWPITELAKTVTLQDAPARYATKVQKKSRGRDAAYELALRAEREYRAGDQLTYYVTGEKKSVAAHENSKLVAEWDAKARDENIPYYRAKLDALFKKFYDVGVDQKGQGELGLSS